MNKKISTNPTREICYSLNGENYYLPDRTSIPDLVRDVMIDNSDIANELSENGHATIYLANPVYYRQKGSDIYDNMIELFQEQAYDEMGELAEGYLDNIDKNSEKFLKDRLNKLWNKFLKVGNNYPQFYRVENVSECIIYEDGTYQLKGEEL